MKVELLRNNTTCLESSTNVISYLESGTKILPAQVTKCDEMICLIFTRQVIYPLYYCIIDSKRCFTSTVSIDIIEGASFLYKVGSELNTLLIKENVCS